MTRKVGNRVPGVANEELVSGTRGQRVMSRICIIINCDSHRLTVFLWGYLIGKQCLGDMKKGVFR